MTRLQFLIRQRKHQERTEAREWLVLVACLIGVAIAVAVTWARDEKTGDCYYSDGRQVHIGHWTDMGGEMVCAKR